jgi:hypothetical protein
MKCISTNIICDDKYGNRRAPASVSNVMDDSSWLINLQRYQYLKNVAQFRYLGTTITNQNQIQEEIKRRLNSGNACYHSVQNLSSSRLLSKNVKMRI